MNSKIVIKNLKWGLVYQFINMMMGFITPRFIMLAYGSEINGLQNSILQIINIIALLQAGITSASVFLLYKPLSEENFTEVTEVLQSAAAYFRKIALFFFSAMLAAAVIFTFTTNSGLKSYEVFISFFILGLKTTFDIWLVSRYLIIFTADQNKYIISIANIAEKLVYYILLFLIISQKMYFVFMYIGLLAGTLAKICFYRYRYRKLYGGRLIPDKQNNVHREIDGKNHSMINEISHTVVVSSMMIIVSSLYDLKSASVYSTYYLVVSLLITIDVVIYESFASSFGHLVAEGDRDRINSVFAVFQYGFNIINTFLYMCAAYLIVPFVKIYTRGVTDINYENYYLAFFIVFFGIMYTYRIPYNICVTTHGLFKETSAQPAICCGISIILSIILGKFRMELIIAGPIFFYAVNYVYQYFRLKKLVPNIRFNYSFIQTITSLLCVSMALLCSRIVPLRDCGIAMWIWTALLTCLICFVIVFFAFFAVNRNRCVQLISITKRIVKRRWNR